MRAAPQRPASRPRSAITASARRGSLPGRACDLGRYHRLFSFITQNWRGKPLVSYQTIVQLIAATTTRTGLNVKCEIDHATYPAGIKVSDNEMVAINITPHKFHGEWNYTIRPKPE